MTGPGSTARDAWSACREAALASLGAAFENVHADLIGSIADDLRRRDRVFVAGAHGSYAAAIYLYFIGRLPLPSFQLLELEFGAFLNDIVDMTNRDAVVCLSPTPSSKAMLRLAELAREREALVVTLTDDPSGPLCALSDHRAPGEPGTAGQRIEAGGDRARQVREERGGPDIEPRVHYGKRRAAFLERVGLRPAQADPGPARG